MKIGRNGALTISTILAMACAACSSSGDNAASSELAQVSKIQCSVTRGAFVPRTASGEMQVTCPAGASIAFNGEAVDGNAFTVKPKDGINVLHVDQSGDVTDIPFLYGTFSDPKALVREALALHVSAAGLSKNGTITLPLPAEPTALNVSQIATQVLRDQGNILALLDGTSKDVSKAGFHAGVKVLRSSYDPKTIRVITTPRDRGVHLDVTITSVKSLLEWTAGVAGHDLRDQIEARIGKLQVSADVDLALDAATHKIAGTLAGHDLHVTDVDVDSAALSGVPLGLGEPVEDAIGAGAKALLNHLADPLLDMVKGSVIPKLGIGLESFRFPNNLPIPFLGGSVDIKQELDGASFEPSGLVVSAGANVLAPVATANLPAPGFFSIPSGRATFDDAKAFGASLSLDYVNQALFAVWKQGLLHRQVSGPVSVLGMSTDAIVADAKLPPVILPDPAGNGINLNVGELELDTVFHSASGTSAHVRIAVTLVAGAKVELVDGGEKLVVKPTGDAARTKVVAELIGVPSGDPAAADELQAIFTQFLPVAEAIVTTDLDLPPVAIPSIDLGIVSPGFAGKKGRFDGEIRFDGPAARINVEGQVLAQ
jgi:hypothetical protein